MTEPVDPSVEEAVDAAIDGAPLPDLSLATGAAHGSPTQPVSTKPPRARHHPIRAIRSGIGQTTAVGVKELRGRVRGRRAFVVLTFYLLFLALFAWAWELVAERAYVQNASLQGGAGAFASALVGQEVFGALVLVETLLVVFLAPAFTSGAISLEREKQTLDMLTATPISSLAIVVGKLFSALAYVFLLIAASIPMTAIVFVFGGVGPDDVVRAYAVLIVTAIGLGAMGLFISAAMQRTQGATVVTFFTVLFLTLGTMFGVLFWNTMAGVSGSSTFATSSGVGPIKGRAPEALLWLNPFAAQYDVICGASDGYGGWCSRLNTVTNGAISATGAGVGSGLVNPTPANFGVTQPVNGGNAIPVKRLPDGTMVMADGTVISPDGSSFGGGVAPGTQIAGVDPQPFGLRRDTFWPRSLRAWAILSVVFILASIQLVSPTRRWRWLRLPSRRIA
jgi:ABC-type transport system involved in multi-copper enzyme maturation permease subunit